MIATTVVMAALWLLMSGLFKPLLLGLGAGSVLFVIYMVRRMDATDGDRLDIPLSPFRSIGYLLWLMAEIARANWQVTKIILSRKMPMRQHLFRTPHTQNSDLGQVIFATSITLTPGTITVETEDREFLVHALNFSNDDLAALTRMDQRVTRCETSCETTGGR